MPLTKLKRFQQFSDNKQVCLYKGEADYVYKQVDLGREINPEKMQYHTVHSICSSSNENVWLYSDTDNKERNPYEEMMMNEFERCNIYQTIPEMESGSVFSNIVEYTQYEHFKPIWI